MAKVVVSPAAKADLVDIFLYIAQDNFAAAERVYQKLEESFSSIARQPGIGRERNEYGPGIRILPVGNYVLYYKQAQETVSILRVLHGARDQMKAFDG